jgi:D-glycero-alpha-D-manno-heptose-7-phosphate kinase
MIITRTPFRISFCGGGSDLPSFYEKHGGCVLSTTINKYMYIAIHPSFYANTTVLKYSQTETVKSYDEIKHRYFRSVLKDLQVKGIEIASMADVPAGTGLGSSSSFLVGLLHALYTYKREFVSKERLASEACTTEIQKLGEPIGKQDQYAAAYGGLNYYTFNRDGSVFVEPVILTPESYQKLNKRLMMFYTSDVRSASSILAEQSKNVTGGDKEANQIKLCELTQYLRHELHQNHIDAMGEVLREGWKLKKTLAAGISNPAIDEAYETAIKNGAQGGKLLGAGGGGFLLFYVPEPSQNRVRAALNLPELKVNFDYQGSTIIYVGQDIDRG